MARRNDPRFDDMHHAPIFKKVKKDNFKTKLDDRFKTVLTDDRFNASALSTGVDKHGRKKSKSKKKAASELKAFYNVEDSSVKTATSGKPPENKAESRLDYLSKLSRGEISGSSSESSDDSDVSDDECASSSDDSDEEDLTSLRKGSALSIPGDNIKIIEGHSSVKPISNEMSDDDDSNVDVESSNRLAIQNCDWDNMSAEDIMAILRSFCDSMSLQSGSVKSVTVYPSDYGLERMEWENLHGPPKEIWNDTTDVQYENNDSIDSSSGSDSESDHENIMILEKDKEESLKRSGISVNKKVVKKKEFDRDSKAAGLVFNLENVDSDKESSNQLKGASKAENGGINTLALREYELSKLRYYFAIAELENATVAEKLYAELDGIEFEHSSMALDLRFVPNDVSFDGRKVRDIFEGNISAAYAPPEEFVVDALQKTNVECSWDNDDGRKRKRVQLSTEDSDNDAISSIQKGSTKKNTTASAWRRLQESDMSKYMASESDSDDSGLDVRENNPTKRNRAAQLRKLLLSGNEDDASDDFFERDSDSGSEKSSDESDDNNFQGDTDKEMSFFPTENQNEDNDDKKKSRKQRKAEKKANKEDWDVPQETLKRLREEKKADKKKGKKYSSDPSNNDQKSSTTELELLFAGDNDSDDNGGDRINYTKKQLAAAEELKSSTQGDSSSKKKSKRKMSKAKAKLLDEASKDAFEVDVTDNRFSKVLDGDANYGIDRLSNDFRPTSGMDKILKERNSRQIAAYTSQPHNDSGDAAIDVQTTVNSSSAKLSTLAKKLKKNFNKK